MKRVKITTNAPKWPLARQTPGEKGVWENYQFFINDDTQDCDWWFVLDGITKSETALCDKDHTVLITNEPPSIKSYAKKFIGQFGTIVTCHPHIKHPHVILDQQSLPWMVGTQFVIGKKDAPTIFTKNYDELKKISVPKTKLISVISSYKKSTRGHRDRLKFCEELKKHFGDNIDFFGRGLREVSDKWDAIAPYKYHIALENSSYKDYWTEKLTDTFLAQTYPFYYGCPNIDDYFPSNSLTKIDISNPTEAIKIIEKSIKDTTYENSYAHIIEARNQILDHYQIFPHIVSIIENIEKENRIQNDKIKSPITLVPEPKQKSSLLKRLRQFFKI